MLNLMIRTAAGALLAAATLTLAGCAGGPPTISADDFYDLAGEILTESSPADLDAVADEMCDNLRTDAPDEAWLLSVRDATDAGLSGKDAGALIAYIVSYKCPDMLDRLPSSD